MPISSLYKLFKLTAQRANGSPVVGAVVRLLDSDAVDVTASFFGTATPTTDSVGVLSKTFLMSSALDAGVYTIQVSAPGFITWQVDTSLLFFGEGTFTATLERPTTLSGYTVTYPPNAPMSSMTPIVVVVESPNSFDWEYIRCTVVNGDGSESVIEAPVDKTTGLATIDFRNRISLGIRPMLVGDGLVSTPDTDFSAVVSISFASLSDEGETPIAEGGFSQPVAQTLPPEGETDLSSYVGLDAQSWIVPSEPVIAFRGYYRDVMVWLPVASLPGYHLITQYYDRAGQYLSATSLDLSESPYVQRIRLNTEVDDTIGKCVLTITSGETTVTKPLTVLYRD